MAGSSVLPLVALVARPALSLAAQPGVTLLLRRADGQPRAFRRAAGWWMVYGTAVDVGCGALLPAAVLAASLTAREARPDDARPPADGGTR